MDPQNSRNREIDSIMKYMLNDRLIAEKQLQMLYRENKLSHQGFYYLGMLHQLKGKHELAQPESYDQERSKIRGND